ncbi:uncharacterized protein BO96DRAFT_350332 [Aspergillus niger CBS 101883]|uniref:Contig An01c0080, genomic contig n=2 Tax=Aspergillus niger TaxID=5061 RepID=A2Q810_ASPNC|nr:uncharacterized protein BO96DRAFT_350332 [Aspergillus niger CBS 101883]XP_059603129.1 uncharacterized protein An01g02650 [Aspergillus niger]PYH51380.1 hypothetical protein BO96DRAFT_350332 [Aspergillus niger CBS 101883]CAK43633.1 unnamed protein product [Aspergillus niger]
MALPRIVQERGIKFSLELSPDKEHARHSRVQETFRVGKSRRRSDFRTSLPGVRFHQRRRRRHAPSGTVLSLALHFFLEIDDQMIASVRNLKAPPNTDIKPPPPTATFKAEHQESLELLVWPRRSTMFLAPQSCPTAKYTVATRSYRGAPPLLLLRYGCSWQYWRSTTLSETRGKSGTIGILCTYTTPISRILSGGGTLSYERMPIPELRLHISQAYLYCYFRDLVSGSAALRRRRYISDSTAGHQSGQPESEINDQWRWQQLAYLFDLAPQ